MKLRIAKRIMREHPIGPMRGLRESTWWRARFIIQRSQWRHTRNGWKFTKGYRWGKWDPAKPVPPWDVPF